MGDQELEVKFFVHDLRAVEASLQSLGAQRVQPRTHEINLRFDTPAGDLTRAERVLRLRKDSAVRLTYKGPSQTQDGVRVRQEIEFEVDNFDAARAFFEALDYHVSMTYEKYRAIYELDGVHVTLDEMPYGNFVEIEGPDPGSIRLVNQRLGLDWEARVPESYAMLFQRLRAVLGFTFRDLSFANFERLEVPPAALNVRRADR